MFQGPRFSGSNFFGVQAFQGPGFSKAKSRAPVQALEVAKGVQVPIREKPFASETLIGAFTFFGVFIDKNVNKENLINLNLIHLIRISTGNVYLVIIKKKNLLLNVN